MANSFIDDKDSQILWVNGTWHISTVKFIEGLHNGKIGVALYKNDIVVNSVWLKLNEINIYTVSEAQKYFLANPNATGATLLNVARNLADQRLVSNEIIAIYALAADFFSPLQIKE